MCTQVSAADNRPFNQKRSWIKTSCRASQMRWESILVPCITRISSIGNSKETLIKYIWCICLFLRYSTFYKTPDCIIEWLMSLLTVSLCSCCWIIAAHPQKAKSSWSFCLTRRLRSRCLSHMMPASLKTRCFTVQTISNYLLLAIHITDKRERKK